MLTLINYIDIPASWNWHRYNLLNNLVLKFEFYSLAVWFWSSEINPLAKQYIKRIANIYQINCQRQHIVWINVKSLKRGKIGGSYLMLFKNQSAKKGFVFVCFFISLAISRSFCSMYLTSCYKFSLSSYCWLIFMAFYLKGYIATVNLHYQDILKWWNNTFMTVHEALCIKKKEGKSVESGDEGQQGKSQTLWSCITK